MTEQNKFSTAQLAKKRGIAQNQLFTQLNALGLIQKDNDLRVMTEAGERQRVPLAWLGEEILAPIRWPCKQRDCKYER